MKNRLRNAKRTDLNAMNATPSRSSLTSYQVVSGLKPLIPLVTLLLLSVLAYAQDNTTHFVLKVTTTAGTNPADKSFTFYTKDANYDIDWGNDQTFEDTGVSGDQSHTFPTAGVHTIRFRNLNNVYINSFMPVKADAGKYTSIEQWGTSVWNADMSKAFQGASNLTMTATDTPDMSAVTNMPQMFFGTTAFNGDIGGWNTALVTNMFEMFFRATAFNRDISRWNTEKVTSMSGMFSAATAFNGDISKWNTASVTTMSSMFTEATSFNQDIGGWNTEKVMNMERIFLGASSFNSDISRWNTALVTNAVEVFSSATSFNQDIGNWNTEKVTAMNSMFLGASDFNQDIGRWNTEKVTNMSFMFNRATSFNGDIGGWNTEKVTGMSFMFRGATSFNGDIGGWNTEKVTNISFMFTGATAFNQDIGNWNTAQVTTMSDVFSRATSFNQDIGRWNTEKVTNISSMFSGATSFNQDIGNWNTAQVTTMSDVFSRATSFNQDISRWNTAQVTKMEFVFSGATLSPTNYDSLLVGWNRQNLQTGVTFSGGTSKYRSVTAHTARENMTATTANGGDNWTITDGGQIQSSDAPSTMFLSSTSIAENAGANAVVGMLSTNGGASSYTYALVAGEGATDNASFRISGTALQLIASADYETKTTYAIRLKVAGIAVEKQFTITVRNVNDNAPVFAEGPTATVAYAENATTAVTTILATDADAGQPVTFTLSGGTDAGLFTLSSTGELTFNTAPDYESPVDTGMDNRYEVTITATDNGTPEMSAMQALTITVTDVNEHAPVFAGGATMVDVVEGTRTVTTVTATDADPRQTVAFVLSGADAGLFSVTQAGELTFNTAPNYEMPISATGSNTYTVDVTATDEQPSPMTATQTLTITVTDVNDAPVFAEGPTATVTYAENSATPVTTVVATDEDAEQTVTLTLSGVDASKFSFTSAGVLTFKKEPDFENPIDTDGDNIYEVTVTATDRQTPPMTVTQTLTITVTDVVNEDGNPTDHFVLKITTNPSTNASDRSFTFFTEDTNYDIDWDNNGTFESADKGVAGDQSHTFPTAGEHTIRFNNLTDINIANSSMEGPKYTSIEQWGTSVWNTDMSFAFQGASNLTMSQNAGTPNMSAVTNMRGMFFNATSFNGDISGWNTAKVTDMVAMFNNATSFDQNIGGWNVEAVADMLSMFIGVTLSIANYDSLLVGWNRQNLQTGVSFHAGNSKYSSDVAHIARGNMTATTANGGDNWGITDGGRVNVHAPVFTEGTTATAAYAENATTAVTTVRATDADTGQTVTFTLSDGADAGLFTLTPEGVLAFNTAPDFEIPTDMGTDNGYEVIITATDDGTPPMTATQALTITVTDVNEHAPVFTSAVTMDVAEGTPTVTTVGATDADAGQTVAFALSGGADAGLFSITPAGDLTFNTAPDFEMPADVGTDNVYEVTITATDGQTAPMTATQTFTITVTNLENEHAPVFTRGTTATVAYAENGTTAVTTVTATDADSGQTVTLTLSGGGADASLFSLSSTGNLTFNTAPDFEMPTDTGMDNMYEVTITATDNGTIARTAMQVLTITVTDENDNVPVFANGATATVAYAENATTAVTTVVATDADAGQTVTFTLSGADAGQFSLSSTGDLTFNTAPDFEMPTDTGGNNEYEVIVTATDGQSPPMTAMQVLTITVTDENDNVPVFANGATTTVAYAENATTAVTTVLATDADAGQTVTFTLSGGADAGQFSLSSTGELTFNTAPDFEMPTDTGSDNRYEVTITATDGQSPPMTAMQALTITVTDMNDNAPVFAGGTTVAVAYAENATKEVTTAVATDADAGQTVTFTLSGADAGLFSITPAGELTFNTAPDFEMPTDMETDNVYEVTITATDGQSTPMTAMQVLTITVTDVNDNVPVFANGATATVAYAENATTEVTTVLATDEDAGQTVTFTLSGGGADAGLFTITLAGELAFNTAPDFEIPTDMGADNVYEITITATDNGTPEMTAMQVLTVTVTGVNEHAPVFAGGAVATVAYAENNTTAVTTVTATDADAGETVTFTLTGGADVGLFSITTAGELTFNTAPDFEMPADMGTDNVYEVTITATDGQTAPMTATQTFTITVTDANDAPVFTSEADVNVAEGTRVVTTVTVMDADASGQTVTFTLSDGADAGLFSLSSTNNELTFNTAPDFENPADMGSDNRYEVTITATDNGTPKMTAMQALSITVTGVNEHAPVFTRGTAMVEVAEGSIVATTVTATDADAGQTVSFLTTLSGDDAGRFSITPAGELTFNTAPDYENPGSAAGSNVYTVDVTATDGQVPARTTRQRLTITVTDVQNEHAPVFVEGATATVAYAENDTTAVTTVVATDADVEETVTFTLSGGADAGLFSITPAGVLTFNTAPDFEMPADIGEDNMYEVTITASDNGTPEQLVMQALTITVTDVDDVTTGLKAFTGVSVYPNPAGAVLHIRGVAGNARYTLSGIDGKVWKRGKLKAVADTADHSVAIPSLKQGIYLLQLTTGKGSITRKIVKE